VKRLHATAVAIGSKGVLLRGRSGSGKSDLALRLIDGGAKLVADDVVEVEQRGAALMARAPARLKGRMEVRGVGIVAVPTVARARIVLVVDLVAAGAVERYPEPASTRILGIRLKLLKLWAFEASAPAKLRLAVKGRKADSTAPR
jgi:serine kinase of HPr protein (carbohydrate metabolism regulator)